MNDDIIGSGIKRTRKNRQTSFPQQQIPPEEIQEEQPQFQLKYFLIPVEIRNAKLSWTAGAVFAIINLLDHPEKGCWASNEFIAEQVGTSTQTVSNHIQSLIQYQFITSSAKNEKRILRVNLSYKSA